MVRVKRRCQPIGQMQSDVLFRLQPKTTRTAINKSVAGSIPARVTDSSVGRAVKSASCLKNKRRVQQSILRLSDESGTDSTPCL